MTAYPRLLAPLDLEVTSSVDGHMSIVLLAAAAVGLGGVLFWSSKLTGRAMPDGAGLAGALLLAGGALLAGGGDFVAGFFDQPPGLVTETVRDGAEAMNVVGLIGYGLFALGALALLGAYAKTLVPRGPSAPADPWQGHTLEWLAASPPPVGNFREALPVVRSERPLLDRSENGGAA